MAIDEASSHQHLIIGITTAILFLAVTSCVLRLYARHISNARLWYDDTLMCAGLFFASIPCVCNYVGLRFGYGKHAWNLPTEYQRNYFIDLYVLQLAWSFTFPTIKLSVLFFYRRIFPSKRFLWVIYGIGLYTLLCFISNTIVIIAQCQPVQFFWQHTIRGHCIETHAFYVASGCLNLASDVFILLMPIPILWNLKTSKERKVGLIVVFLLGGFACVVSFIRVFYLHEVDPMDITWSNVGPGLLSTAEGGVLVLSANLPLMRPLFTYLTAKIRLYRTHEDDYTRIKGPLILKSLPSHVKTDITQGRHQASDPVSNLDVPLNQVGVTTEVSQTIEDRDQMV